MTNLDEKWGRYRRLFTLPVTAALVAASLTTAEPAEAQGRPPVLRTPTRKPNILINPKAPAGGAVAAPGGAAAPVDPANAGKPGAPGAPGAPGGPAAPGGAGADPNADPMAGVKMGSKEIDFKPKNGAYYVNFNLDDADLPELVKAISNITGKRFIYGGKLRAVKATVYSPEKVTATEAYQAFLSILDANGMTVIPHGRFLKIVESQGVVADRTEIHGPASPVPNEDRYVTRMYRLAHIDATETATMLKKFASKEGDISVYAPGNMLIITETGSNIHRLLKIVEEIDVGGAGEQLWVEPINYTSASELANKLIDILDLKSGAKGAAGAAGGAGGATKGASGGVVGGSIGGTRVVADDRGNSLIIVATEPDYLRLLELIKRLDVKQSGEGEIHVLPLQYAACKDLSQTLNQILGTSGGTGAVGAVGAGARPPGAPGVPGQTGVPGQAGAGIDQVFEGRIRVTCDESTNSIVTTSSLRDYAQLRTVIDRLDRPRRQVFIEAVIMDVSIDHSTDFGLGYHGGAPINFGTSGQGVFYGGNNPAASISGVPSNLEALALGLRGPDIPNSQNLFGTGLSIPALGVVLSAMAKDGDSNVLATPHILATDNTKAEISIGQNIPLQTNVQSLAGLSGASGAAGIAALGATGGLGLLGGTGQRQDVGTKISVTPHVNDSDQVRLELAEEISEAGAPLGSLGAIPINKRTATTTLVVRDQQTVVIGGLVRDAVTTAETKVPVLGDIPVLGFLFKQSSKTKQKSNLLLILTPYVIRDQDDLRGIFERKMQERQEFLDRYFVFSDGPNWAPPRDYSRTNGLVEDIRQSLMAEEEKAKIEADSQPKKVKVHVPQQPIPLPTLGGRSSAEGDGPAPAPGGAAPANPAPAPSRPRVKGGGAPAPRQIDRLE